MPAASWLSQEHYCHVEKTPDFLSFTVCKMPLTSLVVHCSHPGKLDYSSFLLELFFFMVVFNICWQRLLHSERQDMAQSH